MPALCICIEGLSVLGDLDFKIAIRAYRSADWDRLIDFIVRQNAFPEQHICYFGYEASEVKEYLSREHIQPIEKTYLLAISAGEIVGVLGAEYDPALGRAWLEGPLVITKDWEETAEKLYQEILHRIPSQIRDFELCGDAQNQHLRDFALRHQFTPNDANTLVFGLYRKDESEVEPVFVKELSFEMLESFGQLHAELFPNTYYNSRQLYERMNAEHKVFVIADGFNVVAYISVDIVPNLGDAYVHFIGIDPQHQQRGFGTQLLGRAIHWAFQQEGINHIGLSVRENNNAAIQLYNKFGFTIERRYLGYRKRTP